MSDINIQMQQRNANNTAWDNVNPKTTASNVLALDGSSVESHLAENVKQIGNINDPTLDTTLKGKSLTEMTKVLFTNANNGKTAVANSLVAKGVSALTTDTFTVLASKIDAITFDASKLLTGNTVMAIAGTMPNNGSPSVTLTTNGATKVIPAGYSPGGTVSAKIDNLVASNIIAPQVVGGVTGTAINGVGMKKYASGTLTATNQGKAIASGLGFTPSAILLSSAYQWLMYSVNSKSFEWNNRISNVMYGEITPPTDSFCAGLPLTELSQYVNSTGFSFHTNHPNRVFTWEAWG